MKNLLATTALLVALVAPARALDINSDRDQLAMLTVVLMNYQLKCADLPSRTMEWLKAASWKVDLQASREASLIIAAAEVSMGTPAWCQMAQPIVREAEKTAADMAAGR
jgi:hypothetical protein